MSIEAKREKIKNVVEDLVTDFLHYDRQEDEELSKEDLHTMIDDQDVLVDEVVMWFKDALEEAVG